MKKIAVLIAPLVLTLLAGCSELFGSYDNYDSNYSTPGATSMATPGDMSQGNGTGSSSSSGGYYKSSKPKPYSVTPDDQAKYDQLTSQIKNHEQQVQGKKSATAASSAQNTVQPSANTVLLQPSQPVYSSSIAQ